jgi:hypothetical protein
MRHNLWIFVLLIYAVAFVAEYEGSRVKIASRAHEPIAARVLFIKNILIGNGSDSVDRSHSVFDVLPLLVRKGVVVKHPDVSIGGKERFAAQRFEVTSIRERWQRFYNWCYPPKNTTDNVDSGSFAAVTQSHFKFRNSVFAFTDGTNRKNVGSQFFLAGVSGSPNLESKSAELQESYNEQTASVSSEPPFDRRFLILFLGYIGGFFVCLRGIHLIDRDSRLLGWCSAPH